MPSAVERLVNLALYLAAAPGSVTAVRIRQEVGGYSQDGDEAAFKRMLERDKDVLRSAGLAIISDDEGNYHLDRSATYVEPFTLSAEEAAVVRTAGIALLDDPSFPFAEDLRLALAKIAAELDGPETASAVALADEDPERQGVLVAELISAATGRKRATFGYTNTQGASAAHTVEPYGVFLHDGRWYLVARDTVKQDVRTYAVARVDGLKINASAPRTPDFERPADFDVATFVRLPFQYGPPEEEFEATLRLEGPAERRAASLAGRIGDISQMDGHTIWRVNVRSARRLMRFVVENGPGITLVEPSSLGQELSSSLSGVGRIHG